MKSGRTVDHFGADLGAKIEYTGCTGSFGDGTKIGGDGGVAGTTTAFGEGTKIGGGGGVAGTTTASSAADNAAA